MSFLLEQEKLLRDGIEKLKKQVQPLENLIFETNDEAIREHSGKVLIAILYHMVLLNDFADSIKILHEICTPSELEICNSKLQSALSTETDLENRVQSIADILVGFDTKRAQWVGYFQTTFTWIIAFITFFTVAILPPLLTALFMNDPHIVAAVGFMVFVGVICGLAISGAIASILEDFNISKRVETLQKHQNNFLLYNSDKDPEKFTLEKDIILTYNESLSSNIVYKCSIQVKYDRDFGNQLFIVNGTAGFRSAYLIPDDLTKSILSPRNTWEGVTMDSDILSSNSGAISDITKAPYSRVLQRITVDEKVESNERSSVQTKNTQLKRTTHTITAESTKALKQYFFKEPMHRGEESITPAELVFRGR